MNYERFEKHSNQIINDKNEQNIISLEEWSGIVVYATHQLRNTDLEDTLLYQVIYEGVYFCVCVGFSMTQQN